jgi:hypothetical protein
VKTIRIIAAVAVLAVAGWFAVSRSGGRSGDADRTTPPTQPGAAAAPPSSRGCTGAAPATSSGVVLTIDPTSPLVQGSVSWIITATNDGNLPVELVFPSGQDAEIVIRQGAKVVYRWSDGQMFTQAVRCQVLLPHQRAEYFLGGLIRLEPGEYELEASVKAQPSPRPLSLDLTVSSE